MPRHNSTALATGPTLGIVAPGRAITRETAARVEALAAAHPAAPKLVFHPQCFLSHGHFAGPDATRSAAFLEVANDPAIDAVWFACGGYGACRLDDEIFTRLTDVAREKTYLGYSDTGMVLARLYKLGIGQSVHGPMPVDITREGGEAAVIRALDFLTGAAPVPMASSPSSGPCLAFNLTILSALMGTDAAPDLSGHAVMIEEVGEYLYRIDRMLCHVTGQASFRQAAGLLLGRCSAIPENDPDFGQTVEDVARYWCGRRGIPYLGRADIGHDIDNKIVPFGGPIGPVA